MNGHEKIIEIYERDGHAFLHIEREKEEMQLVLTTIVLVIKMLQSIVSVVEYLLHFD